MSALGQMPHIQLAKIRKKEIQLKKRIVSLSFLFLLTTFFSASIWSLWNTDNDMLMLM